jgi:hypothetical protein
VESCEIIGRTHFFRASGRPRLYGQLFMVRHIARVELGSDHQAA